MRTLIVDSKQMKCDGNWSENILTRATLKFTVELLRLCDIIKHPLHIHFGIRFVCFFFFYICIADTADTVVAVTTIWYTTNLIFITII